MRDSLISIIVPIYNVEKYLKKCIDSIIAQTYDNLEIILVNDGSPDNCGQICDEYEKKDNRIRVIHQDNGGLSAALNTGLDAATGLHIGFVDPDDWIEPNMYEHLIGVMDETVSDIVQCKYCTHSSHDLIPTSSEANSVGNYVTFTLSGFESMWEARAYRKIAAKKCTTLYKAEIFYDLRFSKGHYREDAIILPNILSKCNVFTRTSMVLYHIYSRNDSISNKERTLVHLASTQKILSNYYHFYRTRPEVKEFTAILICEYAAGYSQLRQAAKSTKITKTELNAHIAISKKIFRICFADARKSNRYKTLSKKTRLYFRIFYYSPSTALWVMKGINFFEFILKRLRSINK